MKSSCIVEDIVRSYVNIVIRHIHLCKQCRTYLKFVTSRLASDSWAASFRGVLANLGKMSKRRAHGREAKQQETIDEKFKLRLIISPCEMVNRSISKNQHKQHELSTVQCSTQ